MTIALDIPCPECGRSDPVQKVGIGSYRCTECDREFDRTDIEPVPDEERA